MFVNIKSLDAIIKYCSNDKDDIEAVVNAINSFEEYHKAIYEMEITRMLKTGSAIGGEAYREQYQSQDKRRTINHNAVQGMVNMLNRLAAEVGVAPFYDGVVSEEKPYRRQVANAVLEFVNQVILNRV